MKDNKKFAAFAMNMGLVTHVGSYENFDEAETALQMWREDDVHNRTSYWMWVTEIYEVMAA